MDQKKVNKEILNARNTLRKFYSKYAKELYEVTMKIDKFLETMQNAKD